MMKLLKFGAVAAVLVAVLVWPLAWYLDSTAMTVHYITPFDQATVEVNRYTFEEEAAPNPSDDAIIAIYGARSGSEPERIVLPDESKIIRPEERDSLVLYAIPGGERPTQSQFVFYLAKVVSIGGAAAAFVLVLVLAVLRRRKARSASG